MCVNSEQSSGPPLSELSFMCFVPMCMQPTYRTHESRLASTAVRRNTLAVKRSEAEEARLLAHPRLFIVLSAQAPTMQRPGTSRAQPPSSMKEHSACSFSRRASACEPATSRLGTCLPPCLLACPALPAVSGLPGLPGDVQREACSQHAPLCCGVKSLNAPRTTSILTGVKPTRSPSTMTRCGSPSHVSSIVELACA